MDTTKPAATEAVSVSAFAAHGAQPAAADAVPRADELRALIAVLQSDAAPFDKDVACRRLAIIGTKEAVPALAALLPDETLSDIARYGLEPIPDASVDGALRVAMGKVSGRRLIGVVTSVGNRRDQKAVPELVKLLGGTDQEVAAAAARSLGKIGGTQAADALERALGSAAPALRVAAADASLWCGQALIAEGKRKQAVALYDRVRASDVPPHLVAAATRSAVLERGNAGIALLRELLKSDEEELFGIALRIAREMPGPEVAKTLSAIAGHLPQDRGELLKKALRERESASAEALQKEGGERRA